jgi:phospholipid-binding lipoprotein MlaA
MYIIFLFILLFNVNYSFANQAHQRNNECLDLNDPYERINRKIFVFNSFLDYMILRPVALTYDKATPNYIKLMVSNFIDNVMEPNTTVQNLLQGKPKEAGISAWRFVINSTIGIGGLLDFATPMGLRQDSQDFGSTLGRYGVKAGHYLVIPFFGSSNTRDVSNIFLMQYTNPLRYDSVGHFNAYTITKQISDRAEIIPMTDYISKNSLDPYVSIRILYNQKRRSNIRYTNDKCNNLPVYQDLLKLKTKS